MTLHRDPPRTPKVFELSVEDRQILTQMFMREAGADLMHLESALQGGHVEEAAHRVHRLYGAALTVGATALIALLEHFERTLRSTGQIPPDSTSRLAHLHRALQDYPQRTRPVA